jgi:excisionase family DNA binding protein
MTDAKISVTEAAEILGVSRQQTHNLVKNGTLAAEKVGNAYALDRQAVEEYAKEPRRPGRPRKATSPMYAWGQLVAEAERMLYDGRRSPIAADKAVSQPHIEFPKVGRLVAESGRDDARYAELMERLDDVPPERPTLPEQGQFWLGYYHYRQDMGVLN